MDLIFDQPFILLINLLALFIMIVCLVFTYRLRARVQGGLIKRKIDFLFVLVLFFTVGYLVPPFLGLFPDTIRPFLVACFSVFGAIYVTISIMLLDDVIQALSE